jgi:hypothetical protein
MSNMSYEGERYNLALSCVDSLDAEPGMEMPEPHTMSDERQYHDDQDRDDAENFE